MNHEESQERDRREVLNVNTQSDIRSIKIQIDKLSGVVGTMNTNVNKLETAIKGNDMGTDGMVHQVKQLREEQSKIREEFEGLQKQFENIKGMAKTNQRYILGFIAIISAAVGIIGKSIADHLFKK